MDYRQELEELIGIVTREGASDLHLTVGRPPTIRVTGDLIPLVKKPPLRPEDALGLISEVLSPENKDVFLKTKNSIFPTKHPAGCAVVMPSSNAALWGRRSGLSPARLVHCNSLICPRCYSTLFAKSRAFSW